MKLFELMGEFLKLKPIFSDTFCLRAGRIFKGLQLIIKAAQLGSFIIKLGLSYVLSILDWVS